MTKTDMDEAISKARPSLVLASDRRVFIAGMRAAAGMSDEYASIRKAELVVADDNDRLDLVDDLAGRWTATADVADRIRAAADELERT